MLLSFHSLDRECGCEPPLRHTALHRRRHSQRRDLAPPNTYQPIFIPRPRPGGCEPPLRHTALHRRRRS